MNILLHTPALLVLLSASYAYSAKILGVFNIPSVSHQVVYQPIWKELSLRGHEVTVITPNPLHDPTLTNLTEIDMSFMYEQMATLSPNFSRGQNHWQIMQFMFDLTPHFAEQIFGHGEVRALINDTTRKFDVVLAEYLQTFSSAFAARFECPLIAVSSVGLMSITNNIIGNPVHPILFPDFTSSSGRDLSFPERVDHVLYAIWEELYYTYTVLPETDKVVKKYFGNNMPYLGELEKNVSMAFVNTHSAIHMARPYLPSTIEMGKMHIKPKKPLPQDLKSFLDDAKEGVIYFSLGSNVKSIHIDKEKRKLIIDVFSELPYKVLWKFEADHMEGKPDNVKISKWLPQQDLLGHPNIKLFITQAGLQSTEEAISNNVPLLAMPFIGDQQFNANRYVALGIGLQLDFATLTKEEFKSAILEITQNPKYKRKVQEVGYALRDEPNTGLERAIWWTEYVIRHKGAPYFRSPALDMPWYQYYLLDILVFFVILAFLIILISFRLFRYIVNKITVIKTSVISNKQKVL